MDGQSSPERCEDASSIVRNQTTSADDELTVGSGEESDSEDFSEHDSNDLTARSLFTGQNGRVRFATCPPPSRTRARNLRHTNKDQLVLQKPSKIKLILLLTLLMKICCHVVVKHTNERARRDLRKRSKNPDEWMPFDLCEMKGIVNVLYLIGVYRCQHQSLHSLWSLGPSGRAVLLASFDRNRFEQLLANLGFDSREDRNTDDKSAPFQ